MKSMSHSPTMKQRKKDNVVTPSTSGAKSRSYDRNYSKGRRQGGPFGK